ncbi:fibronectin type III domain-containing protein [Flagellimonas sp.]|uniref:fibronectin type III domain-containing protein n=1 Tax=Flagellimonas sp. TaxID=2058762 RepID=UPI003B592D90
MKKIIILLCFGCCCLSYAQTNLVPPSARISELKAWIDAEEQTGANGSLVTNVTDQAQVISGITVEGSIALNIRSDGKKEFSFAGTSNAINLGQPSALDFTPGTDEFTIMGLLGTGVPGQGVLVARGDGSTWQYGIDVTSSKFWTSIGHASFSFFNSSTGLVNENIHFTLVVKQTESSLYIDGQLIETRDATSVGNSTETVDVLIGAHRNSGNSGLYWEYSDHIRNIGIFSKALSTSEIQAIYTDLTNSSSDTQSPTAPTISSTGKTDTTIDLSWSGATDNVSVTGYKIFKDGNLEVTLGNVTAYQVTGLTASTSYNFTATALDATGNESSSSSAISVTTDSGSDGGGSGGSVWSEANSVASYSGNVAIGTNSVPSGYKLAVDGHIRTREIRVDQDTWPDYVFKAGYDLPTLEEIQKHIDEKGHLPNIPSAKEVEANGVELGEMNRLLTEKIEELTLYLLQQQTELKKQKSINQKLEKRLNRLENLLKTNEQ